MDAFFPKISKWSGAKISQGPSTLIKTCPTAYSFSKGLLCLVLLSGVDSYKKQPSLQWCTYCATLSLLSFGWQDKVFPIKPLREQES